MTPKDRMLLAMLLMAAIAIASYTVSGIRMARQEKKNARDKFFADLKKGDPVVFYPEGDKSMMQGGTFVAWDEEDLIVTTRIPDRGSLIATRDIWVRRVFVAT